MPASGSLQTAAVLQPSWLVRMERGLKNLGCPAEEIVVGDGRLRVAFAAGNGMPLAATVLPRRAAARGLAATSKFVVGYEGASELDDEGRRRMSVFVAVLRRLEEEMPADLAQPAAILPAGLSAEERFLRLFRFCTVERSRAGEDSCVEVLVRTTAHCNQACPFCSGPQHATPSHAALSACLQALADSFPGAVLTLTGGEPSLRPTFLDEVREALALAPISVVQLQTNAISFASRIDPRALAASPRLMFFVSLHALEPQVYDCCTGTSGQLATAKKGLARIIEAGHQVIVNCVVTSANLGRLSDYVRRLPEELPCGPRVELHFSTLICPEYRPQAADFLVRYSEAAPLLEEAASLGASLGLSVQPLRSSTHASIPACMLSAGRRDETPRRPAIREGETGYEDYTRPWVKASRCRDCVETATCLGVPRPYAERLGLDELMPLR